MPPLFKLSKPRGALLLACAAATATFKGFNRSHYEEGDPLICVVEVDCCSYCAGAVPLLFHGGRFYTEHPLQARPEFQSPAA